ncbi:hypothetical protein EDB86DRAFT_2959011 [Lactarius hatsudake]|nr:hypothetical protein EDB86DRAFT_2959011 [Lactarius hatsudake]
MSRSSYRSGSLPAHLWIFLTVMLTTCAFSSTHAQTPPGMCPRSKSSRKSSPLARRRARSRRRRLSPCAGTRQSRRG